MQTAQERRCASCGADNKEGAGFCWRCYTPFAPAAPTAVAARTARVMPAPPSSGAAIAAPTATSRSKGRAGLIVLGLVVALVVGAGVQRMLNPTYHVPESIAGEPRLHDAISAKFEQTMAQTAQRYDVPIESAVYGAEDAPDLFVVLANGHAAEDADELFSGFVSGAASAGINVDQSGTVTGTHGGADYRCVPMSAQGVDAAACVWRENHSVGMTLDASADGDITAGVFAAYDATHA
jgi:hypothetical protein